MGLPISSVIDRNFPVISDEYRKYAQEKDLCRACKVFHSYNQVVQSEGNAINPTFMFIGECAGQDEVQQNKPFIGRAGQRLRQELRKHRLVFNKNTTIISNVLGCRPQDNKFPQDAALVDACTGSWLFREIKLLKPKVIITLGNPALVQVREEVGITGRRGSWKFLPMFRAWSMATFHPSYVLRQSHVGYIEKQFEADIKMVAENWQVIVGSDSCMAMDEEEWDRKKALAVAMKKSMLKPVQMFPDYTDG